MPFDRQEGPLGAGCAKMIRFLIIFCRSKGGLGGFGGPVGSDVTVAPPGNLCFSGARMRFWVF